VKIKTINTHSRRYNLKWIAEKELDIYISNGVFIAAAISCGFKYKMIQGSPNVLFNISKKSIKSKMKIIWRQGVD